MTQPISQDRSRSASRTDDDSAASASHATREAASPGASASRERLVSQPPPDWERVPSSCDTNAADAARNAAGDTKKRAASTNAARTTERDLADGPYAAAGVTRDGKNLHVGVAAAKGRTNQGMEVELASASVQIGEQNEAQATATRLGYGGETFSGSVEAFTANAHAGLENSDGSRGINSGAGATFVAGEVTVKHSGWSVTAGLSAGVGVEGHIGVRDADKDGKPEVCFRVAAAWGVGGLCLESPVVIRP